VPWIEEHYECTWDLFSSIPSLDEPGASVLTEFRRLNVADPSPPRCRATACSPWDTRSDGDDGGERAAEGRPRRPEVYPSTYDLRDAGDLAVDLPTDLKG
jgi:hypothetical protein